MLAAILAVVPAFTGAAVAGADPVIETGTPIRTVTSEDGSKITKVDVVDDRHLKLYVYSAAMNEEIPVEVWRPSDTSAPRPTLSLLNGAGGGEDSASWQARTDAVEFFGDKNVNVVSPIGGKWSYYTDWKQADPVLGVNKWTTFLTKELPPLVDAGLGTNGINSIAGLSSSGTSVLQLAINAPGLYKGVAAYSGCAQTSDPLGQQFVKLTTETWGGGNTLNMWGPTNDPLWVENDPYVNAEKLRGLELYVASGNGLPGRYDTLDGPGINGSVPTLANQAIVGGIIEAATNFCTQNLRTKLGDLGIPATFDLRGPGTHSWAYWQDDLKASWPVLSRSLGI